MCCVKGQKMSALKYNQEVSNVVAFFTISSKSCNMLLVEGGAIPCVFVANVRASQFLKLCVALGLTSFSAFLQHTPLTRLRTYIHRHDINTTQ